MELDISEIKRLIDENDKREVISAAISHQNRVKFHAMTTLSPYLGQPTADFLTFVKNLIPSDKFRTFQSLFRFPIKSNEVTGVCFDRLSRIFDGRNPAFAYQFTKSEDADDWEYYRKDILNEPEVWSEKGWEFFKTEFNSVLIVDMPSEPMADDSRPQPYFYWLPIDSVITYSADPTSGEMDYIVFRQGADRLAVIDGGTYRMFAYKNSTIGDLLLESPHGLGYCPARFFWNRPINLSTPDIKESPLTDQLSNLDWYLFYHTSKQHLDLYGSYPIYSGYEQNCDYHDDATGEYCDGGYLKDKDDNYLYDSAGTMKMCPKCGNKHIAGAGSYIEIPVPMDKEQADLRNPVQMLTVDRDSLDYNVDEEERLKKDIISAVCGSEEDMTNKEAYNEQQVKASFESQTTILNRIKRGFEAAQKFVDETICKLRYGESFISASISYGTEFYLYDANQLREKYKVAKDSGSSEAELDALQNQIIETEYRNNPNQMQRMKVLADLEPYRHLTREESLLLYDKGLIDAETIRIKLNFANFVRRFERENMDVVEFGSAVSYDNKIKNIYDKLKEYANEQDSEKRVQVSEG